MAELKYAPVSHDHDAFLKKALKRKVFKMAYEEREEVYALIHEMLSARSQSSRLG